MQLIMIAAVICNAFAGQNTFITSSDYNTSTSQGIIKSSGDYTYRRPADG